MADSLPPLVIVDAANVVGSVPDGWWKDRVGATERLLEAIEQLALTGLPYTEVPSWAANPPLEVVLVVEGEAREVRGTDGVRVVPARGIGDDTIVELVMAEATSGRRCLIVTADRELRGRVKALDAAVIGPRSIYPST